MIRVRIIQTPPIVEIDGVALDSFIAGHDYEVGNQVGSVLLAEGWATPLPLSAPAPVIPFSANDPFDSTKLYRDPPNLLRDSERPYLERSTAAESPRRRRRLPRHR